LNRFEFKSVRKPAHCSKNYSSVFWGWSEKQIYLISSRLEFYISA
jgi:hypothetical protein